MKFKWTINVVFLLFSLVALCLLAIMAIANYSYYGKGISYFLTIIIPLISIAIGLFGLVLNKWWVLTLIMLSVLLMIVCVTNSFSFILIILCFLYSALSVLIGLNSRQVVMQLKNK